MKHEDVFWDLISSLATSGLLPHIMIIGSWAEYVYSFYFDADYVPNLKSHDIDVLYGNPFLEIDGGERLIDEMNNAGFLAPTEGGELRAFYKDGLEVEFLTSQIGAGPGLVELPNIGVVAERLANLDMLRPIAVAANNYLVKVPSPASYLCHKLYINPTRRPPSKKPKDIEAVRLLLMQLRNKPEEIEALRSYLSSLSEERQQRIREVARNAALDLP